MVRFRVSLSGTAFRPGLTTLLQRRCKTSSPEVHTPAASARPRVIMPLSVEPNIPRLIYDARKLNGITAKKPFPMDTEAPEVSTSLRLHDLFAPIFCAFFSRYLVSPFFVDSSDFRAGVSVAAGAYPIQFQCRPLRLPHLERDQGPLPALRAHTGARPPGLFLPSQFQSHSREGVARTIVGGRESYQRRRADYTFCGYFLSV